MIDEEQNAEPVESDLKRFERIGLGTAPDVQAKMVAKGQYVALKHNIGDSGTAATVNWANSNVQYLTLTDNATLTFSNPVDGGRYILMLMQDDVGSRTATWPATVAWSGASAPTLTTTASKLDLFAFFYDKTNSKYYGSSALNF